MQSSRADFCSPFALATIFSTFMMFSGSKFYSMFSAIFFTVETSFVIISFIRS